MPADRRAGRARRADGYAHRAAARKACAGPAALTRGTGPLAPARRTLTPTVQLLEPFPHREGRAPTARETVRADGDTAGTGARLAEGRTEHRSRRLPDGHARLIAALFDGDRTTEAAAPDVPARTPASSRARPGPVCCASPANHLLKGNRPIMFQQTPVYDRLVAERGDVLVQVRGEADRIHRDLAQVLRQTSISQPSAPQSVFEPKTPPGALY
ncbi:hypothetical protein GCM10010421_08710 [Streptomyces glaucus]|uniref:Uncharacterized protein n=2 Tax=Streptomyces glaucus TaxID=284029 RepID=A0ABN3JAG3_9ACTN